MNNKTFFQIIIITLVIAGVGLGFFFGAWYIFRGRIPCYGNFMWWNRPQTSYINRDQLNKFRENNESYKINRDENKIVFSGKNITIPIIGAEHDEENKSSEKMLFPKWVWE